MNHWHRESQKKHRKQPCDDIWRHTPVSSLLIDFNLTAPSHYQKQWWFTNFQDVAVSNHTRCMDKHCVILLYFISILTTDSWRIYPKYHYFSIHLDKQNQYHILPTISVFSVICYYIQYLYSIIPSPEGMITLPSIHHSEVKHRWTEVALIYQQVGVNWRTICHTRHNVSIRLWNNSRDGVILTYNFSTAAVIYTTQNWIDAVC